MITFKNPTKFLVTHSFLFIIIFLRILLQSLLLLKAAKYLNTDECTVGTMAIDIIKYNKLPFYLYWQVYHGAATLRALFAAVLMFLVDIKPIVIKMVQLLLDITIIILTYIFSLKWFGKKIANLAVVLYIFTPPLVIHSIGAMDGYLETIIFNILMAYIFFKLVFEEKLDNKFLSFLLGVTAGFGYYLFELTIIFIFTLIIWIFVLDKKFFISRNFLFFLGGFIIGNSPAIYFNITHDFANWKYTWGVKFNISKKILPDTWGAKILGPFILFYMVLKNFGLKVLFLFFEMEDEGNVLFLNKYRLIFTDVIQFFIYFSAVVYLLYVHRKNITEYFKSLLSVKTNLPINLTDFKYIFMLSFIIAQISAAIYNPQGYRFLLPIFPFFNILISALITNFLEKKTKIISLIALIFLISDGIVKYSLIINREQVCINFDIQWGGFPKFIVHQENCEAKIDVIKFLKNEGINFVLAPHHASAITFYSQGEIIGSIFGFLPRILQRDNPLNYNFDKFAILVYKDSQFDKISKIFLQQRKISPQTKIFDELILYYNLDRSLLSNIKPEFLPE